MSDAPRSAVRSVEADVRRIGSRMVPAVRDRRDVDGCACLACRNLEPAVRRRSILETLLWSVQLVRTYPSVVLFALAFVSLRRLLELDVLPIAAPVVGLLEATATVVLFFLVRAYVAVIVTTELSNVRMPVRNRVRHSLERLPALVGVIVATVAVLVFVWMLSVVPTMALFAGLAVAPVDPAAGWPIPIAGVLAMAVTSLATLFVIFKLWLAMEACIVGGYGPLASLRISWRITGNYRGKLLAVVLAVAASVGLLYVAGSVPVFDDASSPLGVAVGWTFATLADLTSVVWFGVYAHLYVQGIVDG